MATLVWISLCKQAFDITASSLTQTCPQAQRIQFQTTVEALSSNLSSTSTFVSSASFTASVSSLAQPFDYVYAGSIWTMAFTFVVGLYMVSKKAGLVLEFIRRA
jgi:hypothetical protein